jgi:hypothetical protein
VHAETAQLTFESTRRGYIFVSPKQPVARPELMQEFDGKSMEAKALPSTGTLYVWDFESGNVASKPVAEVDKKWIVSNKEFNRIGLVSVRVEYKGEAVSAARVVLNDRSREQSQILDESARGEADFYVVQPGALTVTVEYRSGGAAAQPLVQQFTLDLQRKTPNPLLKVALPNEVATVGTTSKTVPSPTAQTTAPAEGSPIGSALVFLITLVIAVGVAFGLYQLAKKNPDWLKGRMKQLGVDVPEPPVPDDLRPVPELIPAKPQPQSKIILDDGVLPASPATSAAAIQVLSTEPRLIKNNGEIVNLAEGETIVGREANLGLSLVGEGSVSRRHASITRRGSMLMLKDLGSTNGTYVNGRKIQGETAIASGDEVQFGAVKFRVENR